MVFTNKNKESIHLYISSHSGEDRILGKGNSTFRKPPRFNNKILKYIINQINLQKYIDESIVVSLNYYSDERIHFLFKVENSKEFPGSILVVFISSLISKKALLPFRKVSIDKRVFIEESYTDIVKQIDASKFEAAKVRMLNDKINEERVRLNKEQGLIPPLRNITGLKIVKKKDATK